MTGTMQVRSSHHSNPLATCVTAKYDIMLGFVLSHLQHAWYILQNSSSMLDVKCELLRLDSLSDTVQ